MRPQERLIVALDVDSLEKAKQLVEILAPHVGAFKVGMQLYNSVGPEIIYKLKEFGTDLFIDLKLHDIPNTVAQASRVLTAHGANILNVHAAGGSEMMRAAALAVREEASDKDIPKPLVIAVTVLTSISQVAFNKEIGFTGEIQERVVAWARLAQDAGLDGVVASPWEISAIRQACGREFVIITPGIRPVGGDIHDQKRVMTPKEAVAAGATYIVVGRPITGSLDPVEAAKYIVNEISMV
ncbi:orotidine-5'-phosphate decarboxylase [Desulfolucanica intricata]|uniref:orotidine-5'-phosphate decarboxylase n=1 Tax=Desulfolucanica intricata TaxID=1285191 RepID=UPI000AD7FE10|nr:orotidine-5'-phosphate decarboxylase [Desulfolucanica intricata]